MSLSTINYSELIQLVSEHPEWREEVERAGLNDVHLSPPEILAQMLQEQERTRRRLRKLMEDHKRLNRRMNALARSMEELHLMHERINRRMDQMEAQLLEMENRHKLTTYTIYLLRFAQVISLN